MLLNEIKPVLQGYHNLSEGVIPPHLSMTLGQVINDGRVTNNVQNFVLAGLVSMFKDGGPTRWPRDLNAYSMSTDANLIESIKSLTSEEAVGIATWLFYELQKPVAFETNPHPCYNPAMQPVEWVKMVLHRQK